MNLETFKNHKANLIKEKTEILELKNKGKN